MGKPIGTDVIEEADDAPAEYELVQEHGLLSDDRTLGGTSASPTVFPDAIAWATAYCSPSGKTCRARGREALTRSTYMLARLRNRARIGLAG